MTELEMIERAKMYIDKLANGIDPITDREVPEGDTVNSIRISRCFFFVSDILRKVIENGGVGAKEKTSKAKKEPFRISYEDRMRFDYSDAPLIISEITKRINALSDNEDMTSLKYGSITGWLMEIGMMESPMSGRGTKLPTAAGKEIGIITEARTGLNGPYTAVLYSRQAQQFIIDNLDAVIEFELSKSEAQGQPWDLEQDERLKVLYENGASADEIAMTMKRTVSAINSRLSKLGYK